MKTRSDKLVAPAPEDFVYALRGRLAYDPDTGEFSFRKTGKRAGCLCKSTGYVRIRLWNVLYHAHRLAWLYVYGCWPEPEADHRNGVRSDNRIGNLRLATSGQNKQNQRRPRTNTSGVKGVSFDASRGLWRATICVDGEWRQLGRFNTQERATEVYTKAARRLQGEFYPITQLLAQADPGADSQA